MPLKPAPFSSAGVSFNSVYTQIWRVLLHLAADPYPDVSDLAMKVLNSIAYKVRGGRLRAPDSGFVSPEPLTRGLSWGALHCVFTCT